MSRRVGNIAFMVFMAVVAMIFIGITTYTRGYVAIGGEYVLGDDPNKWGRKEKTVWVRMN